MNTYKNVPYVGRLKTCVELVFAQKVQGKVIFDIGSSNGLLASLILPKKPKKYEGVDPSDEAIKFASKNNAKAKFYKGVASKLPVKDNSVDIALMFDVIEHVPLDGEVIALKEAHRILKKGGTLLLSTPNNNIFTNLIDPAWYLGHRHYYPEEIQKFLKEAGFSVKSIEVKGNLWFSIYLIILYINKWIFRNKNFRNEFLEKMDDNGFKGKGIHTIFVKTVKV